MSLVLRSFLLITLLIANSSFASNAQTNLRASYQKWTNSYQSLSFEEQQALLNELTTYPLYPYAAVQFLQSNIKVVSPELVRNFITQYNDFPLTSSLIQAYLAELTNRQDWNTIVNFPQDGSPAANCRNLYAQLQQNSNNESIYNEIESLWMTGKELPSACDSLINAWSQTGKQTGNMILLRIELALESNNIKLARYLANTLDSSYQTTKSHLLALFDNPQKLSEFSKNITASKFTKKIVLASFARLAKADMNLAEAILPKLIEQQALTEEEQIVLQKSLADRFFNDSATQQQIEWRDNFIAKTHDMPLVEKRIRVAIDNNDFKDIAYWLTQLDPKDQLKDDWQYWQARVLLNNNQREQANTILQTLSNNRGFYGMISAQTLNQPYILVNLSQDLSAAERSKLNTQYDTQAFIKRINELRFLGMISESNREWRYALRNLPNNDYLQLARYAYQKGWGDLSIQATISGKLWDNWTERLPIMYQNLYNNALKDKVIPLSYALAISRQESALDTTIQSPVGASGLMQLMPATAKDTAKKMGYVTYNSPAQLFDPEINIQLGTYYLNSVYLQNNNNRILSSSAYNAGPNRVKKWLNKSGGKLDAVSFIDSIPFTETRNYVKNVLTYDYIYKTILKQENVGILTTIEFNQQY